MLMQVSSGKIMILEELYETKLIIERKINLINITNIGNKSMRDVAKLNIERTALEHEVSIIHIAIGKLMVHPQKTAEQLVNKYKGEWV